MTCPTVLLVCDLSPRTGVGHLMRCLALADELVERGFEAVLAADADTVPLARDVVRARGLRVCGAVRDRTTAMSVVTDTAPVLVVVDSYELGPVAYDALRSGGTPVLAVVDGDLAGRTAEVYLNPNLGGERPPADLPPGACHLGGIDYALLRDEVLVLRGAEVPRSQDDVPTLLMVFGGTDPYGAAPILTRRAALTGLPFRATVVAEGPAAEAVRAVRLAAGQRVTVVPPTAQLGTAVTAADAVVSAAGTSVWELLFLGAAAALVRVAENQRPGYDQVTATGAVLGLGALSDLRDCARDVPGLSRLLGDPELRARLRGHAARLVDGRGRARVVDATLQHLTGGAR